MAIAPDTADWTWVLTRPCTDCGFDASTTPATEVARLVRANAFAWATPLNGARVRRRPDDSTWSPLEYACHVRDVFRLYDARLHLMLEQDDPLFANWDQNETAVSDDYLGQDPHVVLTELTSAAEAVAVSFDAVQPGDWERSGRRSDGASFTVDTFARYFVHDPIHHLWDVTGLRFEEQGAR